MQQGHNIENSIIPATFTALTVKFYALQLLSALLSRCSFFPAANKRPVRTNISIVQKTCVFRPVDISVAALKRNKLIYQSVYSLLGTELPQSKPIGFASSLWEGANPLRHRCAMPPPRKGEVLLRLPAEAQKAPPFGGAGKPVGLA